MATTSIGSSGVTFPDSSTQASSSGVAKAWVRWTYTASTLTIQKNYNVSSITRTASGFYVVNFTNAFADANYSAIATCTQRGGASAPSTNNSIGYGNASTAGTNGTYSTTAINLYSQLSSGSAYDAATVSLVCFR